MKLVKITWRDAQFLDPRNGQLTDPQEFEGLEPAILELVGWLVAVKSSCLVVAQEHDAETDEVKLVHIIPRKSVLKIQELEMKRRRSR